MTKFLFINDIHIGSKYQDIENVRQYLDGIQPDGLTVLNGDIVDLACCPKKDVAALRAYQHSLLKKWGKYYVSGNHDLLGVQNATQIVVSGLGTRVMVTHGDLIKDYKKWYKYRFKEAGASFLKLIWVSFADTQDWVKDKINTSKLEPMFAEGAAWAKRNNCTVVVMGHLHNTRVIDVVRDGVRIVINPPGVHAVYVD